ncbi:MAG: MSHA biogenesis protein MshJ [Burkholderiales bacterium]|nr:MSHA biogenesis protein MshJ [Burkholderiales bacterium]
MSELTKRWQHWAGLFNARSLRERVLITAGLVAVVVALLDTLLLSPLEVQQKRLSAQLSEARTAIKAGEILIGANSAQADPDEVRRRYRDELRKQIAEMDGRLQGLQKQLVPPDQVAKLLESVLKKERGLALVSLRKLPVQRYQTSGAPAQSAAGSGAPAGVADRSIYQHSFELSVEGSYAELHGYLARLEALPWQLFWGKVTLDAGDHPKLRLTLTLHTLSLNKVWLVV